MVKLFIVVIMIMVNTAIISTHPLTANHSEDIHDDLIILAKQGHLRNIHSIKSVLTKYVNTKFQHLPKYRQRKILTILVQKIQNIVNIETGKKPNTNTWMAKGDMLARMLK